MKKKKLRLPEMASQSIYAYRGAQSSSLLPTDTASTHTDPTTSCTTILTTTHFDQR